MALNETILSKLESSRKELLDLGMRNSLLNYKLPAGRGLHIVQEKSAAVYEILVRQGKAMSFTGRSAKEDETALQLPEPDEQELEEAYNDTRLQSSETETVLLKRLLNTYYAARTSMEEQGVNILYISLGMLRWFESGNSEEERSAPLLLIPVSLERSSVRERFRVRYTLEEIGENVSLQEKMKLEFGIEIKDLPEPEDFDTDIYFDSIQKATGHLPEWKVEKDAIELGFFSFGKFMIYNDLDNSRWPLEKMPVNHPLFHRLFESGFQEGVSSFGEDTFIDRDTIASQLFQVVDADSSQILTMLAAREGKNLVIQGPPGTGKSQTITNLIADAIGQGKKILFVAEKMAALEVVKRRLDSIGMGEACLELHSHKANKKEMHQELMRVLELGKPDLQRLQQEVALLEDYKKELNDYCFAVNTTIGRSGLTVHAIVGRLLQLPDKSDNGRLPKVQDVDFSGWDGEKISRVEAFAERIQARLKVIGVPAQLLFWGSARTVLMPEEKEALVAALQQGRDAIEHIRHAGSAAAAGLGVAVPVDRKHVQQVAAIFYTASLQPDLKEINIKSDAWLLNQADLDEWLESGRKLAALHTTYAGILLPEAWNYPVMEIRQELLAHAHKWYKFVIGSYNKSSKQLAALCKISLPKETAARLQYVDDILEAKRLSAKLTAGEPLAKELFGRRWQQLKSDWPALVAANNYLAGIHQQIAGKMLPIEILDYLSKQEDPAIAKRYHMELINALVAHQHQIDRLLQVMAFDEPARFSDKRLPDHSFDEQWVLITNWLARNTEIYQVLTWNTLVETAAGEGLEFLTGLARSWPQAKDLLKAAVQKQWYEYLLQQALYTLPALNKFQRDSHEEVVQQFRRLDRLNLQYNRGRAAGRHWEGVPRADAGGQVNILKREFNKKARHKPVRKLVEEAGLAIQAIKPVFMMSPLSIANFLPPGSVEFDVVIFDEASQVKPVDALGAILRAKQLIVVGDTKQLPPTSFFDSLAREGEEENVTADMQSILGMCQSQGLIPKMLRWHYRSRHESLITLSNHEFYENKLVVFPSPGSRHRMGLMYHHLPAAYYDRGKTRTNLQEAETVATAVIEHAIKYPGLSLGVVAFSSAQRQAIQDALEIKRRIHADAEPYFRSHPHEPFFVKNLENVQGDERDVIFISIGYGRTEEGYVAMSFGPLNNEGGERRLNVLITRAKLRCEVFTNLTSNDIDLERTKSYGIRTLKNFLHFAQHGKLNTVEETGLPFDSPFEENVYDHLTKLGYTIRNQVGSQGFYIDLAIVDAANPGRYTIGIECDGAAYHSARSARDRDRLRQQVLENIGWKIHRVWSTDWYRDPEKELKRLVEAIEKAREMALLDDEAVEQDAAAESMQSSLLREEQDIKAMDIPLYETARLPAEIARQEIHLYPVGRLSAWIEEVVKVEGPVHFDEVAKRVVDAGGVTKIGSRIRETLQQAVAHLQAGRRVKVNGEFLWLYDTENPVIRNRSLLANASRKIKFISPEEIMLAIEEVVQNAIAIAPGDAAVLVAKMFGFTRVTEEMKNEILEVVDRTGEKNNIQQEGGFLKVK